MIITGNNVILNNNYRMGSDFSDASCFDENYTYEDFVEEQFQILKDSVNEGERNSTEVNDEVFREIMRSLMPLVPFITKIRNKFYHDHFKYPFIDFYYINRFIEEHDLDTFLNGSNDLVIVRYCKEDPNQLKMGGQKVYDDFIEVLNQIKEKLEENEVLNNYGTLSYEELAIRGTFTFSLGENAYTAYQDEEEPVDDDTNSDDDHGAPEVDNDIND